MSNTSGGEGEREQRINEALADYFRHADNQDPVDAVEFIKDHADLAVELEELLEAVHLVERMAGPVLATEDDEQAPDAPETGPPGSTDAASGDRSLAETLAHNHRSKTDDPKSHQRPTEESSFGDYDELEAIGRGGMGVVYRAREVSLNRIVAVKMIRSGVLATDRDVERFYTEAQSAGKLRHPNIVKVYQVGEVDGQHFYSMEFVEGSDLAKLIRREKLPPQRIARLVKDVAEGIQHAHEHQIVHRDLKPANILIDQHDRPLVTDFGLAKDFTQNQGLTSSGSSLGTPSYMSPEQAAGKLEKVGAASDIYSLGAILYELLTGRPPFKADSTVDTILEVIHKAPIAPRSVNRCADKQLEAICLKCLSKDPNQRYTTAMELADDLKRYLKGAPVLARRTSMLSSCWHWLRDVPFVAAAVGRRVTNPTIAHRIVQWLAAAAAVLLLVLPFLSGGERPYPSLIRIAAGSRGGEYHEFGSAVRDILHEQGHPAAVLPTEGAGANLKRLLDESADAGLLQASAVSPFPAQLAVVAPLYQEFVYFIVRTDSAIDNIADFAGEKVIVGKASSGMQQSARQIVQKLGLSIEPVYESFARLEDGNWRAAIVTSGPGNLQLNRILSNKQYKLLPLVPEQTLLLAELNVFRRHKIEAGSLAPGVPPNDVATVSTRTYLVVHKRASSELIDDLLDAVSKLANRFQLDSLEDKADWGPFPLHQAAKKFFDREKPTE